MGSESSAVDMFLQIGTDGEPIEGETLDPDFPGGIQIKDFKFTGNSGLSKPRKKKKSAKGKGGKEKDEEAEEDSGSESNTFVVSKQVDSSSPQLMLSYCRTKSEKLSSDDIFDSVKITVRKSGGPQIKFLVMYFEDVFVIGYDLEVNGEYPEESVTFAFSKIEMSYSPQGGSGQRASKSVVGWDFGAIALTGGQSGGDGGGGGAPQGGNVWQKHQSKTY